MTNDPEFGDFWDLIFEEYEIIKEDAFKGFRFKELMQNEPANKESITTHMKI